MLQEIDSNKAGLLIESAFRTPTYRQIGSELPIRRADDPSKLIYTSAYHSDTYARLCGSVFKNIVARKRPVGPLRPLFRSGNGKELIIGMYSVRQFIASRMTQGLPQRSVLFSSPLTEICTVDAQPAASWLEEVLLPNIRKNARALSTEILCLSGMELLSNESENPLATMHRHDIVRMNDTELQLGCLLDTANNPEIPYSVDGVFHLEDGRHTIFTRVKIQNFYDIVLALSELSTDVGRSFTDSCPIDTNFAYVGFILPEVIFSGQLINLIDWLANNPDSIPRVRTKLGVNQALAEARKWHETKFERESKAAERRLRDTPQGDRELVTAFKVPDSDREFAVYALKDEQSLIYESLLQKHCVSTYWRQVHSGRCRIFHMIGPSGRWTVETDYNMLKAVQVRGPCNQSADPRLFFSVNQDLLPMLRKFYERTRDHVTLVPKSASSFPIVSRA